MPPVADGNVVVDEQNNAYAAERFYGLVWPERGAVLRLAQVLTGDLSVAEELVQDTLIKAYNAIQSFEEGTDVRAWLAAILRNARIDRLRAAGANPAVSLDDLPIEPMQPPKAVTAGSAPWQEPEDILESFSDKQVIKALAAVPEEIRWALLLVDVEGLDQIQAGHVLAVPVGTIKSRLHRGRKMLREALLPLAKDQRLVRE